MSKAKQKGNSGERELCSILKKVFDGSFIRVPNSGAYIGGKNSFRKEYLSEGQITMTKGDIIPPDFMPKLVIECKFYADFNFHSLLQPGDHKQLETWIAQSKDAIDESDYWCVAFKINRRGWYICIPTRFVEGYDLKSHCVYNGLDENYIVTELTTFIESNKDKILEDTK